MKGIGQLVLYLDFDGVLHHENCLWHPRRGAYLVAPSNFRLFQYAGLLEQMLVPYPAVQIVLSTSWVLRYGYSATAKRLPAALRARVIGATFHSRYMRVAEFLKMPRGQQVLEDVMRRSPRGWLALDDNDEGWPASYAENWVQTHIHAGISERETQARLEKKIKEMCA